MGSSGVGDGFSYGIEKDNLLKRSRAVDRGMGFRFGQRRTSLLRSFQSSLNDWIAKKNSNIKNGLSSHFILFFFSSRNYWRRGARNCFEIIRKSTDGWRGWRYDKGGTFATSDLWIDVIEDQLCFQFVQHRFLIHSLSIGRMRGTPLADDDGGDVINSYIHTTIGRQRWKRNNRFCGIHRNDANARAWW